MAALTTPRFVAFDSSHLGAWASDWASVDPKRQAQARIFEADLANAGCIPLVCWHHLAELFNHNETDVRDRVEFLCRLPIVVWVKHCGGEPFPGSIIDIAAAELQAVLHDQDRTVADVRAAARNSILRVGSGREAFEGVEPIWRELIPHFRKHAEDARRHVAITRSSFNETSTVKVIDLLKGRFHDASAQAKPISTMTTRLANEVQPRGDRRIADADLVANEFFQRVTNTAAHFPDDVRSFVISGLIAKNIESHDIGPDTTLGDLDGIGIFRGQLKVVAEALGLSWSAIKGQVAPDQFPSWVIGRDLRQFGQDVPERKGSDLNDVYLVVLSAYAELTLVDKRTLENVRRARAASPTFAGLVGRVWVLGFGRFLPALALPVFWERPARRRLSLSRRRSRARPWPTSKWGSPQRWCWASRSAPSRPP